MNPDKIPDLNWTLANTYHTMDVGQIGLQATDISTQCVDVDTVSYAGGNKCMWGLVWNNLKHRCNYFTK